MRVGTQSISCRYGPDHLDGPAVDKRDGSSALRQDLGRICITEMDATALFRVTCHWKGGIERLFI